MARITRPGDKIGPYVVEARIAAGGMAEVFLAKKELGPSFDGAAMRLVIKRMLPQLFSDVRFVDMFRREANILATLRHPNVVRIYDFGTTERDELFIAMEYLDGVSLSALATRAWRAQQSVPIELALRVVAEAARALAHVHSRRDRSGADLALVHRDVAPDNLVFLKNGPIKLVDFGVARSALLKRLTNSGEVKGKVPYMAPEVLHGHPADARADLFALGVTAYWLLTGVRPFRGSGDAAVMSAILKQSPPAPSSVNPALAPWIDELVLGLLEKDPGRRTASGAAVDERILKEAGSTLDVEADVAFVASLLWTDDGEGGERPSPRAPAPREPPRMSGYTSSEGDFEIEVASATIPCASILASAPSGSGEKTAPRAPEPISFPDPLDAPRTLETVNPLTRSRTSVEATAVTARPQGSSALPSAVARVKPPGSPAPRSLMLEIDDAHEENDDTQHTVRLTDSELRIARDRLHEETTRRSSQPPTLQTLEPRNARAAILSVDDADVHEIITEPKRSAYQDAPTNPRAPKKPRK